ncbi:polyprenyl synthetase family protein [Clostridium swellfunianum]|uniref:polyprenyl synthetase family protein n=1 Tax=Clostridium swellfunianum TaxID=1367462 RepID=UPI00202EE71B|nr:farnesyl diphosphate synthase [Clostridium swellfunianum]MCM0650366.1 polyprenyl synthetase family protein [Clostridium swellfunianum]
MDSKILKTEVEKFLRDYFKDKEGSYNKRIYEAMSYSINIGGKRIRPVLMLLVYNMYNGDYKDIMPIAAAMEMIHTYSLIHDDLPCMDDDDLRRGKPTNHKVYGEAIAVLAGDALLNEAMNIMFKFSLYKGIDTLRACSCISDAAGAEGMIGGQVVDILSEGKNISTEELLYMHRNKTGALIKAAIVTGAMLGNASEEELEILSKYGEKLGLAFQVKDDILDVTGNPELLGKNTNADTEHSKTNFISTYGLEGCKKICTDLTNECMSLLDEISKDTSSLKELSLFLLQREF